MTTANDSSMHTLLDWNLQRSPDGGEMVIAELMNQNNQFNQILPYREANDGVGHKVGVRTSLPLAEKSAIGKRHKATHGTIAIVTQPTAMAVTMAKVNYDLAKLNGGDAALLREAAPHAEALAQLVEGAMLYGDSNTSELDPIGLNIRRSSLSGESAKVVIDMGGTTNLSSIYLLGLGPGALYGIFPKGSATAGLEALDFPLVMDQTSDGEIPVYKSRWSQTYGLAEEDHRYTQRLANLSMSDIAAGTGTTKAIIFGMKKALARVTARKRIKVGPQGINHYWLMSTPMFEGLLHQIDTNVSQGAGIRYDNFDNGFVQLLNVPMFGGMPIIFSDQLLNGSETQVV